MKNLKLTFAAILVFLLPLFSYALTYDELVDSYAYNYSNGDVNLTGILLNPCTNCTILNITLLLSVNPGTYEISGFFENRTTSETKYFFDENSTTNIIFYPPFPSNISGLWISITKDDSLVYFSNTSKLDISGLTFKSPRVEIINDSEEDGKLNVLVHIEVLKDGEYRINAYLSCDNDTYTSSEVISISREENVSFIFDPGIDGNFTLVEVDLNNSVFSFDYKTKNYSFSKIEFLNDSLIDGDLVLNIINRRNLTFSYYLFDSFSDYITSLNSSSNIIVFNGSSINASALNGPYIVKAIALGKEYDYITGYYNYSDFQKETTQVEETITSKISNAVKNAGSFFSGLMPTSVENNSKDNKKENITEKTNVEKTINVNPIADSYQSKNNDSSLLPGRREGILQNLLTGNAIFSNNGENVYGSTYYLGGLIIITIIVLSGGVLFFIRIRRKN